jgi:hypothetical protein
MPSAVSLGFLLTLGVASISPAWAQQTETELTKRSDPSADLMALDAAAAEIVSSGPSAKIIKNLETFVRGERLVANATTDVWAHEGFAYTGTFNSPCGGAPDAGVWVWNVEDPEFPSFVGVIESPDGSRSNDVKVARMNSGDILVHSNESCAGGPGGFEIYNVDDPTNPVHLASVQTDDVNGFLREYFNYTDFGVHNLFLFTQYGTDYVAVTVESLLGNFQIFDISDPTNPTLVGFWGAESLPFPSVDFATTTDFGGEILPAYSYLVDGYGASSNRFLHDVTISADGMQAYLANWDAGLVLLDISDVTNPQLVSVALDPTSEDGEVNSHAVWPSQDGTTVVESEEDFAPYDPGRLTITSGPNLGAEYPAFEFRFTTPIAGLPGATMSGATTYVGLACTGGSVPGGTGIALIQRGLCRFDEKATNVINAGYSGMVVFTSSPFQAPIFGTGAPRAIPGVMVDYSTGLAIAGVASEYELVIGAAGADVSAIASPSNGWGGLRLWDYSDPANPVLASTFNTVCSANAADPSCDPAGTYSVHNVIVETTGKTTKAYVSWYSEGMLVLDVTDPYNPIEVARFFDNTQEFLDSNGGNPHSFWGVYKVPRQPWIYGSDRNGGLYLFKELGAPTKGRRGR